MAVAKDAVVEVFFLETLLEVDDDAFAVVAEVVEHILTGMLALVAVAPAMGYSKSDT